MSKENKYLLDLGRAAQREILLPGLKQSVKVSTLVICKSVSVSSETQPKPLSTENKMNLFG